MFQGWAMVRDGEWNGRENYLSARRKIEIMVRICEAKKVSMLLSYLYLVEKKAKMINLLRSIVVT